MLLLCSACAPTTTAPTSPASHNGYVLIVEAMDGAIWVESSGIAGEGSCFYFTLPAAAGVAESREPA